MKTNIIILLAVLLLIVTACNRESEATFVYNDPADSGYIYNEDFMLTGDSEEYDSPAKCADELFYSLLTDIYDGDFSDTDPLQINFNGLEEINGSECYTYDVYVHGAILSKQAVACQTGEIYSYSEETGVYEISECETNEYEN